jgi:hypothetical protein
MSEESNAESEVNGKKCFNVLQNITGPIMGECPKTLVLNKPTT